MEESGANGFLVVFHSIMIYGAIVMLVMALLVWVYHQIKVSSIADHKAKYDYIRKYEIRTYKYAFVVVALAVAMFINTYGKDTLTFDTVWFLVRGFISIAGGTLIGYIGALILEYYYPTKLDRKLKKWRYAPRTNPKTGNTMRLLSEDEEDVHLDEGMRAEEDVFSIDYDVWIDETSGETKVEKYPGHLEALQCNNCGFFTMRVAREEIVREPTAEQDGELIKHYECKYCGSVRATQFNIVYEDNYSSFVPDQVNFKKNTSVSAVKLEIMSSSGQKKNYTFQNIQEAEKFLSEFDMDNAQ
ncbi:MAG: hypothetical protein AAF519_04145 [Bacteroidota bacterium]